MNHHLRSSISSDNSSSQNIPQSMAEAHDPATAEVADSADRQPDLKLEIQALQILNSSDDCIKVLDLEGHILFMSRGGQVLLGIQDITPFLNTSWIEFWQGADRQSAIEATARARAGEVCTFQGNCPALSGESKWWDIKISPLRGTEGQVERLLCIWRDITELRQIEDRCKQAEEKSRESQERYQAIIDRAVTGVACTDLDGNLTLVNQKYRDIAGYCADELRQLRMQDITHPEDLPRNLELFDRMRSEGTPFEIEKRYIRKDGSIVWVNNSVSVVCDRDGKPQSAVATVLDITDRKQSEAALRVSEEQFRLFTTASSDTVYKMSADWSVMQSVVGKQFVPSTVNPSGNWLATCIPEEEQPRVQAAIEAAIRTKRNFELEHRVVREDGTIGWTFSRAVPLLNEQGDIVEWFGAASDVTERKRSEEALRESEERFRTLANTAPAPIWYNDAQGNNRFINQYFLDFTGKNAEQIRGEGWHDLVHPDDAESYIADYLAAVREQRPWHNRNRIRRHDGVWRWHDNYAQPLFNADGVYLGHVGVTIDNTDAIEAEAALRTNEERVHGQKEALQAALNGAPLADSLAILSRLVAEETAGEARTAFYIANPEGTGLHPVYGAGSMPDAYLDRVDGFAIGENSLACGLAIPTGRPVLTRDVREEPLWQPWVQMAEAFDYRGCWSFPIVTRDDRKGVGIFAMYLGQPRQASPRDLALAEIVTQSAAVIINSHFEAQERVRAAAALRESEAKYRSLFDSIDEGFCIFEMLYSEAGEAVDFRYIETNPGFERQSGRRPQPGQTMRELFPEAEDMWLKDCAEVARTGQAKRFIDYHEDLDRWFDVFVFPTSNGKNQLAALLSDVTDEKRTEAALRANEERQAFLLQLSDALRSLVDPIEIQEAVTRTAMHHFGADRCYYCEIEGENAIIRRDAVRDGLPSVTGIYPLSSFAILQAVIEAGRPFVVQDVCTTNTVDDDLRQLCIQLQVISYIDVPVIKDGKPVGVLCLVQSTPRDWTDLEVELAVETAERTWAAVERARAEDALSKSEAKYRSLFTTMDQGFCIVEKVETAPGQPSDFRYITVNPAFERHTGLSDLVGRTMRDLLPNAEHHIVDIYDAVVGTRQPQHFEEYVSELDLWFETEVFPAQLPGQIAILFSNVSDRKRSELALRESEERLRDVLNSMSEGFALLGGDFTILDVNEETLRLDRRSRDELIGRSHWDAFPGTEDSPVGEIFKRVVRERTPASLEHVYRWPDGRSLWLDMRAYPTRNYGVAIFWRDVTDRKQAEAALRESEEKYRSLFNSMDEAYAVVEVMTGENGEWNDFLFLEVNPAFVKQTGMDYPVGRKATELLGTPNPQWAKVYGRVAETGEPIRFEEGEATLGRVFDLYVFRLGGEGSRRVAVLFTDITDRKLAEAQLRRAAEIDAFRVKLSDALRSLSDPVQIQAEACRLLGEQLGVDRAYYVEVRQAQGYARVNRHYSRGDSPSIVGNYRLSEYGWSLPILRRGETIVITDTQSTTIIPDAERAAMATIGMVGFVALPLIEGEVLVGALAVNEPTPREWTEAEVELVRETAERIWTDIQRAHAETALQQSEEKYRSLFESINDGFALLEVLYDDDNRPVDCRFLEVSPSFEAHTTLPQAQGKTLRELIPSVEPGWFEHYHQALVANALVHFEMYQSHIKIWFEVDVLPCGNPLDRQVTIVFRNINDRKRAEAALRESQERLQKAISIETVGVVFFTLDGHITDANDTFLRMSGYSRDELRKIADWQELTPPEFWNATSGAAEELAILGKAAPYEKQLVRKDGSRWWGLFSPTRLKGSGRNAECVEFVTDISDRKQAEAASAADLRDTQLLRELSVRLATEDSIQALYQEIMATVIALTQADAGTVQILDETTQDLVLLATQGFEQKMVEHFHRVNASSNTPCGIALRSGVRSFVDFDVPESEDPEGSMRLHVEGGLLSAQSTPLISRSGKPTGMVSTHWRTRHRPSDRELRFLDLLARQAADFIEQRQDAAQRKQLLEREQAARKEAERANRIKDEFLAVLSHELRSPLTPILGWSTLLLNGKLEATKTTQALTTIQRNAKLQSELIEDLLDVARIMRGKLSLNVAPVNVAFAIRAAMETVRLAAEAKSIQIAASLAEDVGLVLGDSTRLQQVVWNLLSNAVKFTPPGGQVSIRLERFDSSAQITVSDTGQGIAPDFLPFVFDYFRQADGATTRNFGGLGLGLAIVRQLVELHGGTVSVASPGLGQGATFTVRVPLMPASSETNQDARSVQQFLDLSGIKILIVDDETDTRELVAFVLDQQGAQVIVATSAREALLILPQAKPDILLSDIGMPEMDGYMLIQRVRRLTPEQGGRIPAIALTAYAGDTNQQQVLAAGFQKHISKPIQPEVLVQAIAHLIHPRRA